jgi:proteasome accessory factor B
MRMFERDKDELRAFGVPIETLVDEEGERTAYRLSHRNFYLPYLALAGPDHRATRPSRRLDRFGYGALTTLLFEPDELSAVSSAAARVRALGDPLLAADAESAVRKLAIDLPVGDDSPDDIALHTRGAGVEEKVFAVVSDALTRRKVLHFDYYAMGPDRTELRSVEPYGLFFLGAHWYLVARDSTRGELRNFRLSRITAPRVNPDRAHTSDYDLPSDFRLREHAHSRQAWELGTGDHVEAIVRFADRSGAAAAASRLGSEVPGARDKRAFQVRRIDAFARWLLSFGGDAEPLSPPAIVDAYREQIVRTLAVYDSAEETGRVLNRGAPHER